MFLVPCEIVDKECQSVSGRVYPGVDHVDGHDVGQVGVRAVSSGEENICFQSVGQIFGNIMKNATF